MKLILLLFTLLFSWFVISQPVLAQNAPPNNNTTPSTTSPDACEKLKAQLQNANGADLAEKLPAYCDTSSIYAKIVNTLYWLIGIVAVIVIIYGGYLYMTARGNAIQVARARSVLTWAVIGLIVAILAAVIVNVVVRALVENKLV